MKYHIPFSGENISKCRLLKILPRVLSIKNVERDIKLQAIMTMLVQEKGQK